MSRGVISVAAQRRRAANVMHAMHGAETTVRGREVARERLEQRLAAQYGLDPNARDYRSRMEHAISAHYSGLRAKRGAS